MEENFQNLKKIIEYSKGGILSKEIIKDTKLNVTLFCMASGTEMSEHTSTKQGFIYVIEGGGVFNLSGEKITMTPNVFIKMDKNAVHSLKAEKNTTFLLSLVS